jgi:recombinational DNA repair ATPase RecF
MDDLASELDAAHLEAVVDRLQRQAGQVLVTGTAMAPVLADNTTWFHVEHGTVWKA